MKLLAPRTLLGQTALLFAVLMLLTQAISTFVFRDFARQPRAQMAASLLVSNVTLIREALENMSPSARAGYVARLRSLEGVHVRSGISAAPQAQGVRARPDLGRAVSQALGRDTPVLLEPGPQTNLWVPFQAAGQSWWLVAPIQRVERPVPMLRWMITLGSVGIAALIGAILLAWRVNRPLRQLAEAARKVGCGDQDATFPVAGPTEVRALGETFNGMLSNWRQLSAERDFMLAGVSHDLRTPITRLRLMLEMAPLSEKARQSLVLELDEMDGIIGQFIGFIRAEQAEKPELVTLPALLQDVRDSYLRAGHPLEILLAPVPPVAARPIALRRLLENLIDNAIKHGGGEVLLELADDAMFVKVAVHDRGPGIEEQEIPYLRKPFTRREGPGAGAGLGLAIAERIAALHGGTLDLRPRPGGGLSAVLTLPRTACPPAREVHTDGGKSPARNGALPPAPG